MMPNTQAPRTGEVTGRENNQTRRTSRPSSSAAFAEQAECWARIDLDGHRIWVSSHGAVRGAEVLDIEGRYWVGRRPLARIVYEAHVRLLRAGEQVHHLNRDSSDNAIHNLQALSASAHAIAERRRVRMLHPPSAIIKAVALHRAGHGSDAIARSTGISHRHARHLCRHRDRRRRIVDLAFEGVHGDRTLDLFAAETNREMLMEGAP